MPRRFDKRGWNRQFKWQPIRRDRWDPFPKDHLPFIDDQSVPNQQLSRQLPPRRNFMPEQVTPESDPIRDLQGNRYPGRSSGGPRRRLWPSGAGRLPYYRARDRRIRP